MAFNGPVAKTNPANYRGKCIYLLMLIKQKDPSIWTKHYQRFQSIKFDEIFEFYKEIFDVYLELKSGKKLKKPLPSKKPAHKHLSLIHI